MTRQEYVTQLTKALDFLPAETQKEMVAYYTEMLDDRMEDGMDEEAAAAAMESPADIAARLRAERGETGPLHHGAQDDMLTFSSLADSVLKRVQKVIDGAAKVVNQGEEKVQETEEVVRNIREEEEQAQEEAAPLGEYEQKVFTCPAEAVRAVRLLAKDMPIVVQPCAGDELMLTYYVSKRCPYRARLEDGVLTLENPEQDRGRSFSFSLLLDGWKYLWNQAEPTITLCAPQDTLMDLTAHTSNASLRITGMRALCDVEGKTSNSRITVQQVICKNLEAKTSNSRLVLDKVEAKRGFKTKTSNARIEGAMLRAGEEMTLATSNGRVLLQEAQAPILSVTTSNGTIQVEALHTRSLLLRTSNGAIRGSVPGHRGDWAIDSGTSNGRNSLPLQQSGLQPLSVHTSNASIDLVFEGDR